MSPFLTSDGIKAMIVCLFIALLCCSLVIIALNVFRKKGKNVSLPVSNNMLPLLACYFACVAAVTIVPLPYSTSGVYAHSHTNLVPLVNTIDNLLEPAKKQNRLLARDVLLNIGGNIVLFLPLGILLPLANKWFYTYKRIFLFAAGFSTLIELTQLFSRFIHNYRQVDIDDVILNTTGAIIGFFIYKTWIAARRKAIEEAA